MSESESERVFRRIIEQGFNRGDLTVFDELVAADCLEHQAHGPDVPTVGPASPKAIVTTLRRAFPDLTLTIEEMDSVGDRVWARLRSHGTHSGPFLGHEPTGKPISIDVIDVVRIVEGKMVEHWGVADRLSVLLQIGSAPRAQEDPVPA
jgi:predicted SnoaL-like aldol condensation-catalyzing enzyme